MQTDHQKIWCVVPAAGIGSRMQTSMPKQYLKLGSATVLDMTIERLLACECFENVIVCISPNDGRWIESIYADKQGVKTAKGGDERSDSVLNGIHAIKQYAAEDDWVLVHDAARPCVRSSDISLLIRKALEQQMGAILAAPIYDTVKQSEQGLSARTLDRSILWRALTPQIFKLKVLELALTRAKNDGYPVTDEASAMERFGEPVQLVEGHQDNIKITTPADLSLAIHYLKEQEKQT